jgi:UDP-N-acetylmuramate: L-alanyl-gamma-D-glutamyl-meso-diaminopimelate ligase
MAGVAVLAKQAGHTVSGSDQAFYPPMGEQLQSHGITLHEGYAPDALMPEPDLVIVGNAIKRGNPAIEWVLNQKIPYISGPEWLYREVLSKKTIVLAVAGTHGKTTTSSMLTWILEATGKQPGFLIGGVPQNFGISARLGQGECFVVEADEYDTAFFDKRSKLVHYHPDIVILNNLEYDHADIFPNLAAIQTQFHHMIRSMPEKAVIIRPAKSESIDEVLAMGCWSKVQSFSTEKCNADWDAECVQKDGTEFLVNHASEKGSVNWSVLGEHNVSNALAAIAAAHAAGVPIQSACAALADFKNVKRRLEVRGKAKEITVYDDFAHHPTAIEATLHALRSHVNQERIIAILHLASNSMKMGIYNETLGPALKDADVIFVLKPQSETALAWIKNINKTINIGETVDELVYSLIPQLKPHDHVLVMSNGDFANIHNKILEQLSQ